MAAFSTAVNIIKKSASKSLANVALAKSLSITALAPLKWFPSLITGIPPPPQAITTLPESAKLLIVSISTILFGFGEATTLLYPLPASSTTLIPFLLE